VHDDDSLVERIKAASGEGAAFPETTSGAREGFADRALVCVDCGLPSSGKAKGWRAHRAGFDTLAFYCPGCAERELRS
jgi:hypothetical protein